MGRDEGWELAPAPEGAESVRVLFGRQSQSVRQKQTKRQEYIGKYAFLDTSLKLDTAIKL